MTMHRYSHNNSESPPTLVIPFHHTTLEPKGKAKEKEGYEYAVSLASHAYDCCERVGWDSAGSAAPAPAAAAPGPGADDRTL